MGALGGVIWSLPHVFEAEVSPINAAVVAGGRLFIPLGPADEVVLARIDGIVVLSAIVHTAEKYFDPQRVAAVHVPDVEPGPHELELWVGGVVLLAVFDVVPWSLCSACGEVGPRAPRPIHVQERFFDPSLALDVGPADGVVVWSPAGQPLRISASTRIWLEPHVWPRPGFEYDSVGHDDHQPIMYGPIVVRALYDDGAVGRAWYVDEWMRVAAVPETEDGRYSLFNRDGTARWRPDAPP